MSIPVPFLDLQAGYRELKPSIDNAVTRVLDSGWYILGPEVEAFEAEYAAYVETKHCVGVADGLDALILALRALNIGPGDEVIVPAHTYVATWLAVSAVGATPVPVEPEMATMSIDPARIASAITRNTRAILPVHLYGQPVNLDPILTLAREHGLKIVEDAAQCHGAKYQGRRIGGHGDIVCWSFYPGKNLGAFGDGGAITTDNDALADAIRVLRNYGSRVKYVNEVKGTNSRLDPLQAAILRVKLERLDAWNARRAELAAFYCKAFAGAAHVELPGIRQDSTEVNHLFVVRTPDRKRLIAHLDEHRIGSLIHYPIPPHKQQAYADRKWASFPIAEKLASEVLSLPIGPHLSQDAAHRVVDAVLSYRA
jgi:dTDP-4-amino-4,6-dideoxygalactose transaminase